MNNSLLPSVSSELCYSFGINETISDINPMPIESKRNFYANSFCFDSRILCSNNQQFRESCTNPSQSPIYYQPGLPSLLTVKGLEDYSNVVKNSLTNTSSYNYKISTPKPDVVEYKAIQKSKKRNKSCFTESIMNKKLCFGYEQQFWDHQAKDETREIPSNKLPVRRSQKLSDKITALQKLVSPYGKTDTASVLQEAYICIKLLQDKIQDLFDELNNSYSNNKPLKVQKIEEQLDLGNGGLCLVPISMTYKLTKENQFNRY